jgi:hypothetical protein
MKRFSASLKCESEGWNGESLIEPRDRETVIDEEEMES